MCRDYLLYIDPRFEEPLLTKLPIEGCGKGLRLPHVTDGPYTNHLRQLMHLATSLLDIGDVPTPDLIINNLICNHWKKCMKRLCIACFKIPYIIVKGV